MAAFSEYQVTSTFDYLRKHAMRLDFNPNIKISMANALLMNTNGEVVDGYPKLRCLDSIRFCPCEDVEKSGECDQGVFRKK